MRSMLLLCALAGVAAADVTVPIDGHVANASGKHVVHVALWTADNFLDKPTRELTIPPGGALRFHFDVAPGRWVVSAYEDKNDNGTLDVGMFGPKEPQGFWRPFKAWRKPRFTDVDRNVGEAIPDAVVTLK